jgi:hypothetical protein
MAFTNFSKEPRVSAERIGAVREVKPVEMVLNRNYTLASTLGHVLTFKKDKPMPVPPIMVHACAQIGAVRVDGKEVFDEPESAEPQPVDPAQRQIAVRKAVESIVDKNERDDFTAGGSPKVSAVSRETGFKVDMTEVRKAWQARNERLASNDDAE